MSTYNINYFKKLFFENNYIGEVTSRTNASRSTKNALHSKKNTSFWFGNPMIFSGGTIGDDRRRSSFWDGGQIGTIYRRGSRIWYTNGMDTDFGAMFIRKAQEAKYSYLRGYGEDFFWLVVLMNQFQQVAQDWMGEEHYLSWKGIDFNKNVEYSEYGQGPWDKTMYNIYIAFSDITGQEDGKTMFETMEEVIENGWEKSKVPWASSYNKINNKDSFIEWFNKFFPSYDLDSGGLDFSKVAKAKRSDLGVYDFLDEKIQKGAWAHKTAIDGGERIGYSRNYGGVVLEGTAQTWFPYNKGKDRDIYLGMIASVAETAWREAGHWDKRNAKLIISKVMGDSYTGESSSEFKRVHEEITRLFQQTIVWGEAGEPPADLQKPNNWKPDIYRKAMRIIRRGLWLTPYADSFVKLNIGQYFDKSIPKEKRFYNLWKKYDPKCHLIGSFIYLEWGDDYADYDSGASDNGFEIGIGVRNTANSDMVWTLAADNKTRKHFIRNGGLERGKQTFFETFHDGHARQQYGGKYPDIFAGYGSWKKHETYNESAQPGGEVSNCDKAEAVGGGCPRYQDSVMNDAFFGGDGSAGVEPTEFVSQNIKNPAMKRGDLSRYFKPNPSDPGVLSLNSYNEIWQWLNEISDRTFTDKSKGTGQKWNRDNGYHGLYCKFNANKKSNVSIQWNIGRDFYTTDDDGNEKIADGVLSRVYQGFLQQYKTELTKPLTEQRTANEVFDEATTFAAYSVAFMFLTWMRDNIVFELYDAFATETVEGKTPTQAEMATALRDAESRFKDIVGVAKQEAASADAEDLTDEEIKDRQTFYKQCFLLMNMDILKDHYAEDLAKCFAGKKTSKIHDPGNEYQGRIRLINVNASDADKASIINRLTSVRGSEVDSFFNARPELISSLVPQIRLFKVFSESDGNFLREIEFDFPKTNNPDVTQYKTKTEGAKDRWEFGIKKFSFSFDGTNPATARNDIKCELSLFFRDFNDLIKKRTMNEFSTVKSARDSGASGAGLLGLEKNKYSYLDLILFPGSVHQGTKERPLDYDPSQFRIRADVGWATKHGDKVGGSSQFTKLCKASNTTPNALNSALKKINKSFYLNMIDHDIDFGPDGSVNIKISYRAYMESATKSTSMDVLATPEIHSIRKTLQKEMNEMWGKCDAEQMNELLNTYKTIEEELLKKSYQSIITRLLRRQRMMYVFSKASDREFFSVAGYFEKRPEMIKSDGSNFDPNADVMFSKMFSSLLSEPTSNTFSYIDGELKEFSPTSHDTSANEGREVVNYFFAGDLFYTLMDCMHEAPEPHGGGEIVGAVRKDVKNTKLLLPSFVYFNPLTQAKEEINMAEIPVAVDFFLEFLTKNVIESGRRSYPLMHFIRDFCNRLIVDLMNELCIKSINPKQNTQFQTANLLAAPEIPGKDPIGEIKTFIGDTAVRDITRAFKDPDGPLPLVGSLEQSSIDEAFNYIVIYPVSNTKVNVAGNNVPSGIRSVDEENGVRHLYIGRPRGLVKTIKFSKVDMQYLREARFFNHGYNGLLQLGGVYRANIDMVGNTLFYPGMSVFINPIGLAGQDMDPTIGPLAPEGPSLANALGIGGYHLVEKVKSTIEPGKFNTEVQAIFYYSGDRQDATIKGPKTEEKNNKSEREEAIESYEPLTPEQGTTVCTNIIKIRQKQTANPFSPDFMQDLSGHTEDTIEDAVNAIDAASSRRDQALKQAQSEEQKKAIADAFEARKKALEESSGD